MNSTVQVKRQTIAMTFSQEFESLMLAYDSQHISLTHDLEFHITRGLELLAELEDVQDLQHKEVIQKLINDTNYYSIISSNYFKAWQIAIAEDLLDEVDLLQLAHGEDLAEMGLIDQKRGTLVLLIAIASLTLKEPLLPLQNDLLTKSQERIEKLKKRAHLHANFQRRSK